MGYELDFDNQIHHDYTKAVNHLKNMVHYRLFRPWTHVTFLFHIFIKEGRMEKKALQTVAKFTNKIIESRQKKVGNNEESITPMNLGKTCYSIRLIIGRKIKIWNFNRQRNKGRNQHIYFWGK